MISHQYDWAFTIIFEGIQLPRLACAIDHLGMHNNLPGLSEQASEWLWRFTICKDKTTTGPSQEIIKTTNEVLNLMSFHQESLLRTVPKHFDGPFHETELEQWYSTLRMINQIAATKDECSWRGN